MEKLLTNSYYFLTNKMNVILFWTPAKLKLFCHYMTPFILPRPLWTLQRPWKHPLPSNWVTSVVHHQWWLHQTKHLKKLLSFLFFCDWQRVKPGTAHRAAAVQLDEQTSPCFWLQQQQMQTFHFIFHFNPYTLSVGWKFFHKFIFH